MVAARKRNGSAGNSHAIASGLTARLKSLRSDVGALQDDMVGMVSDVGDAAGERVHSAMNGAARTARDASDRVESWGNENMKGVRKIVRAQPFTSCAMAAAAGAILGFILRR